MKHIVPIFKYIMIGLLISSCRETLNSVTTISFNPKAETRSVFETGIIKDVRLVRLESDSCIVGTIDKIIFNDSLLYIMDKNTTKEVYVFTREGRFIHKISRQGHGKYEYTQLWDIFFDKNNNTLCLLSRYDQKIISFSPDGKEVIGETKLPKMFSHIVPMPNGYVGYMQNYAQNPSIPYNIWIMDKSFNLLEGFVEIDPQLESRCKGDVNPISIYGETIYLKPEFNNTIFQLKDGKVSEHYKLDFGEKTFPKPSSLSCDNKDEWLKLIMSKVSNINFFAETDDLVLMDFIMDAQPYIGIYNKHKHTSEITFLDCCEGKYLFSFGDIKGIEQSAIYSVVDYEDIYELWLGHNKYVNFEEKYPQQVKNIRKRFPHMEEDGNPFIAIYNLK